MPLLQFSFQATIGRNCTGGIAVDDITLSNGLCEEQSEPQNNRQGINVTSISDTCGNFCDVTLFNEE